MQALTVAPGFEAVAEVFGRYLDEDAEYSAQLAAYHRGVKVLDLSGGPHIRPGSMTGVFSCSKGMAGLVIALLVQDGVLDLDAEVVKYWPEFGAQGKSGITVVQLLSHQAGLLGAEGGLSLEECNHSERAAARLAALPPIWKPGAAFGYHALTIGVFMEELCRRITGSTLQEIFEQRIRAVADADFFLGLPDAEEPRYATLRWMADPRRPWMDPASHAGLAANAGTAEILDLPNIREVRAAGLSSVAGVASAEGMARVYAAALTGLEADAGLVPVGAAGGAGPPAVAPLLSEETIRAVSAEQVFGIDRVFGDTGCFATVFMKPHARMPFGSYRAFGHDGAGGALGYADPVYGLGFGYVPQQAEPGGIGCRNFELSAAVRQAVSELG
ncbi:serine hydrolase domain-containing protein [Arthrobacter cupressi]|uniref:CubicO group peptidase, beta-lactamase class C family n=1 Tax=Arthrobacter cupressi TaxID=1045773 RepID=A0A1G8X6C3_9MICC|nr:serine hydrolase domain-containing protein [Arthrobacter cupressi]NYD77742.1 CubicO group peptidase (beta-lactamase class C family) [Arthrobacter cupressi]SDJ86093.1 CubicO group peptidase, beta-lactamase class C family [Arthrobacter cupressi]